MRSGPPVELGPLANLPRVIAYLAVPVRGRRGDVIGGIALGHSRAGAFDSRDEQLVIGLASLTATAIDSARLFREAHELIAALEKSNRELDEFAYVTSHDLRAPLRGIANLSRWIEEDLGGRLTEGAREHLRLLRARVRRLEDSSRRARRTAAPAPRPRRRSRSTPARSCARSSSCSRHRPSVRFEHRAADLPLALHVPRAAPAGVHEPGRATRSRTTAGPIRRLTIGCSATADGWEFHVRDNGPGIPLRYQPQIWGLFQHAARARQLGEHRHRPRDRAQDRRGPRRAGVGRVRGGPGRHVPLHLAARERPRSWRRDG